MFLFKKVKSNKFSSLVFGNKIEKSNTVKRKLDNMMYEAFNSDKIKLIEVLRNFWDIEKNAITYKEIRLAVLNGGLSTTDIENFRQDYSKLINEKLKPIFNDVNRCKADALNSAVKNYKYDLHDLEFRKWVNSHCAGLVTSMTDEQRNALKTLINYAYDNKMSTDEAARLIRPCIGLTEKQAYSNAKYYEHVKTELLKNNPNMGVRTAEKRARESAAKYAERQHRYRAQSIAQTELVSANNQAYLASIKDAYNKGVIGYGKFVWSCTFDENSCEECKSLDGLSVEMGHSFPIKGEEYFAGQHEAPPAHPNCGCGVYYEELEAPLTVNEVLYEDNSSYQHLYGNNDNNYLNSDENNVIINLEDKNMSLEYQRYGRNKDTLINNTYINSGDYRNKFDKITDNKNVNRILYAKAKEMLKHRSGTMLEDMYWINCDTGEVVINAINEKTERMIRYTDAINKAIRGKENLITLHTHPNSMPPSIADFNSAFKHKYKLGLIICHNGSVYAYKSDQEITSGIYEAYIAKYVKEGHDEPAAQLKALERIKQTYNIDFWEVK